MSLDKYLNSDVSPGLDKIESIAEALDVSVESLIENPINRKRIDPYTAAVTVREYLQFLAEKEGFSWPPSIEFLAKILK